MLKVAHCPHCGRVFQKNLRNLCQTCIKEQDAAINRCYTYLRDHWNATNEDLSQGTGIPLQQITRFMAQSKISLSAYPYLTYPCQSCGGPTREGKLCSSCRVRLVYEWKRLKEQDKKHKRPAFFVQNHWS